MANSPRVILLDSSVAIAMFRRVPAVVEQAARVQPAISATVLGELYCGALGATLAEQEMNYISQLTLASIVVDCDTDTALFYAEIEVQLSRQGTRIPQNDMWVAASARQYGLPLATRDEHFKRVAGLTVEMW